MKAAFPLVKFEGFLHQRREYFTIDDLTRYKRARVQVHAKGIVLRDEVMGSEITTKAQQAARTGELLVAEIDAKVGGFGLVPPELEGAIVSSHYFLFEIDERICSRPWIDWHIRSGMLEEQVSAQGSTNYAAIRPSDILGYVIPLPTLPEQQRIVVRIDALASRLGEAQRLKREAAEAVKALARSLSSRVFSSRQEYPIVRLESVCAEIIDNLHTNPTYAEAGEVPCIRSQDVGRGELFLDQAKRTTVEEYARRTSRGEPMVDDIVFVREGGGTGKAAIIQPGQKLSLGQRVMLLRPNPNVVLPKFMLYQILSPQIYEQQVLVRSKGSASPHLNISALRSFDFILPPLSVQKQIVEHLDAMRTKVDGLVQLQVEIQQELDALIPSVLALAFAGKL